MFFFCLIGEVRESIKILLNTPISLVSHAMYNDVGRQKNIFKIYSCKENENWSHNPDVYTRSWCSEKKAYLRLYVHKIGISYLTEIFNHTFLCSFLETKQSRSKISLRQSGHNWICPKTPDWTSICRTWLLLALHDTKKKASKFIWTNHNLLHKYKGFFFF